MSIFSPVPRDGTRQPWHRAFLAAIALVAGAQQACAQNLTPDEAVRRMTVPDGVTVNCFAAEPMVRQPVAMTFDDRGRLWVVQYLQYPNPAGLKRISVDRFSRTVYDRLPEPPPRGPRGADRITILEDTDGDGRADTAKDFVDGLNLASGLALGYGGVFVVQTPYLLFYPDTNHDDVPDGDPQVLLAGFGMQDAHAVANSLSWGPDGWLYGAQGSTVTANINGHTFQQGIWRYHPRTHQFELFAEGGGNTWGLDFDAQGELIAGTNVGPNAMLHQVQGGYYWKSFGKHGELHNPYTFGYLDHVPYTGFQGGHVTCGGIVYESTGLPAAFRGRYLAANLLSHAVYWHELEPRGSSFVARHGGELLVANDPWFAPVDLCVAPDGAVFVADWHDQRTAHPDPDAEWDRSNGRIYRLQGTTAPRVAPIDLSQWNSLALIDLLASPSSWHRTVARRLIAERQPRSLVHLFDQVRSADQTLEYLWAMHASGGLPESASLRALGHHDAAVRGWAIRLLADERTVPSSTIADRFVDLAAHDPSPIVRSRLASATQRLPAETALPVVAALMRRDEDIDDQQLPLLIWWGLERHADDRWGAVALFEPEDAWQSRLVREAIAPRLARRLAATGDEADLSAAARLADHARRAADTAETTDALQRVLAGIAAGWRGRRFEAPPAPLERLIAEQWTDAAPSPTIVELALRAAYAPAHRWSLLRIAEAGQSSVVPTDQLITLLGLIAETGSADTYAQPCLALAKQADLPAPLRRAAITTLGAWNESAIADELLTVFGDLSEELRDAVRDLLVSRPASAARLIDHVQQGHLPATDVTAVQLGRMAQHQDAALDRAMLAIWGQFRGATPEERLAVVRRLNNDLRAASGNSHRGQQLFREQCGTCHRLFGEGNSIGPDLTTANRQDREFLLVSLVDPSAHVRKEFMNYLCQTTDGRVLTGLVVEETATGVTLVDAKNQRTVLGRNQIAELEPAAQSLMPEGIVEKLSPEQLRDLFAFLQGAGLPEPQSN